MGRLKKMSQSNIIALSGESYTCVDCNWDGDISKCAFDGEYDDFKGVYNKYPICPKCGGGLDY